MQLTWGLCVYMQESSYPPASIDSVSTAGDVWEGSVSGEVYGNGLYRFKSSSNYFEDGLPLDCCQQWRLFRYDLPLYTTSHWQSSNYGGGQFLVPNISSYTLDGTYYGDWVWIEMPVEISMTRFILIGRTDYLDRAPSIYRVYGSNSGTTWSVIHDQTTPQAYDGELKASVATSSAPYRFFGLVVQSVQSSLLNFVGWRIYGKEQVQFGA
jgi:hypothetical protein